MNQSEKETALKMQPVHPSNEDEVGSNQGLNFYQSLILSLAKNEQITGKREVNAMSTALYITDVANQIIKVMIDATETASDRKGIINND